MYECVNFAAKQSFVFCMIFNNEISKDIVFLMLFIKYICMMTVWVFGTLFGAKRDKHDQQKWDFSESTWMEDEGRGKKKSNKWVSGRIIIQVFDYSTEE